MLDLAKGEKKLYIGEEMTHSEFDFFSDVSAPLTAWFKEMNVFDFGLKNSGIKDSGLSEQPVSKTNRVSDVMPRQHILKMSAKCKSAEDYFG